MDFIMNAVLTVKDFLWDYILLFLLLGTGLFFTFRLKFIQVRKFGEGLRNLFGNVNLKGEKAGAHGMSSFQAVATAVAAQIGTGNITGTATALIAGGPGAIFWMWISAFLGMATIYAESVLGQEYRTIVDGELVGGPRYYIQAAFPGKLGKGLATFFSIAIILAIGFMGNMVQSNSISTSFESAFGIPPIVVGVIVGTIAALIFIGGTQRIVSVTEKIVPIMAVFFFFGNIIVLFVHRSNLLDAIGQIFVGAFQPQAVAGGVAGVSVKEAIRYGVSRGLFSNEAGMGTTPHAHALANVEKPHDQGVVAMVSVFIDTLFLMTLTALAIISSGALSSGLNGSALAQLAFSSAFGDAGSVFIAICMLFFGLATIVGWYFFGEMNFKALFGKKYVRIYAIIVVAFVVVGSALKIEFVWNLSDLFNGLMVIPNLMALLALSGVVVKLAKEGDKKDRL